MGQTGLPIIFLFSSFPNLSQFSWQPQVLITIPFMTISPNLSRQETKCVAVIATHSLSTWFVRSPLPLNTHSMARSHQASMFYCSASCQDCKASEQLDSSLPFGSFLLYNLWQVIWPLSLRSLLCKMVIMVSDSHDLCLQDSNGIMGVGLGFLDLVCQGLTLVVQLGYLLKWGFIRRSIRAYVSIQ